MSARLAWLFAAAFVVAAGPASAQSWLDKANKALGDKALPGVGGTSGAPTTGGAAGLSNADIAAGLLDALKVGTEKVVSQVGKADGFNADPAIHIPLPPSLAKVKSMLSKVGMSGMADDLETRLNRAAEAAAPEAKDLFFKAISDMSIDDAKGIYNGPQDAATQYFKGKMSAPLGEKMKPIVENSLSQVGAVQSYDKMMGQYKSIPLVPNVKADLTGHVVAKALDGIFLYVGKEEAAIRQNPAARTTDILKKVFGSS